MISAREHKSIEAKLLPILRFNLEYIKSAAVGGGGGMILSFGESILSNVTYTAFIRHSEVEKV
jgi:hypothetical protein